MDFEIIKLPDKPVLSFVPNEEFRLLKAMPEMIEQVTQVLDTLDSPVFYMPDMRKAKIGLDDILLGISRVALGSRPFLRHPNIREVLIIVNDPIIKKVATSIGSGMYGEIALQVFPTPEAALAYVEQKTRVLAPAQAGAAGTSNDQAH